MKMEQLKYIFNAFQHESVFCNIKELTSGHINDTYLIETIQKPYFVLQRINHNVFKNVVGLINNKVAISLQIQKKRRKSQKDDIDVTTLTFIKTNAGEFYYQDGDGNYWNLMHFIIGAKTFETVNDAAIAYEGGKLFGEFLNLTSDFDVAKLVEVIPKFHDMSFRYSQFRAALQSAPKKRLFKATEQIEYIINLKDEMHILQNLKEKGCLKLRVTHNDTKISNALFTENNKGLCVIDTDTVMPGIVHYDFGDAIRSICNTAAEDEINLDLVEFNVEYYQAYTKGFLETLGDSISQQEIESLPLGAKTMIFIMGLRFLTDYLNNDIYYKTKYPEHNFDRAKNQFKLLQSFIEKEDEIQLI